MPTSSTFHTVCSRCKAYCCTLVLPPVTDTERQQILSAGFPDRFEKIKEDLYIITPDSSSKCPYLTKECSCSIHTVKPHLCMLWPVIPSYTNKKRGCVIVQCPLFPFLSKDSIEKAVHEAEQVPLPIIEYLWGISAETKEKYKRFTYQKI